MTIQEYYDSLKTRLNEVNARLAEKDLDYKEQAQLLLEKHNLNARYSNLFKEISFQIDEDKEEEILNRILPEDIKKTINKSVEMSQKKAYNNYLLKEGNENLPEDERVNETTKLSLDEYQAKIVKAAGKKKFNELKFKGKLRAVSMLRIQNNEKDIISEYTKAIPQEVQDKVIEKIKAIVPPVEAKKKDVTYKLFDKEIKALKDQIKEEDLPLKENGERYTKKEAIALLDFANDKLVDTIEGVNLDDSRGIIEGVQEKTTGKIGREYFDANPQLKSEVVFDTSNKNEYKWVGSVDRNRIDGFKNISSVDFTFSEEHKNNVKYVINKLDEINNVQVGAAGEEKTKTYGFKKLFQSGEKLKESISSGDLAKVLKSCEEYKKDYKDMQDLVEFSKKHFSQDPVIYSGNLDVARTSGLPFEFRQNFKDASHINSCYTALVFIKNNNLSVDDFVNNLKERMIEKSASDETYGLDYVAKQPYKTKTVTEVVDGVPTEKTVQVPRTLGQMYTYMRSTAFDAYVTNKAVDYSSGRSIDSLVKTDPNLATRSQNFGALMALNITKSVISDYTVRGKIGENSLALQNLIVMNDEERDYIKAVPGNKIFNPTTGKIESGKFDIFEHLSKTEVDFNEFSQKIKNLLRDYYEDKTAIAQIKEDLVIAAQCATAKVLIEKIAQKNEPAYQELKAFAEDPYKSIDEWNKEWGLDIKPSNRDRRNTTPFTEDVGEKVKDFLNNPKFEKNLKDLNKSLNTDIKAKEKDFATKLKNKQLDAEQTKSEYLKTLKDEFVKGNITEYYLKTRTQQIETGSTAKLPSLFRIDDFPKRKNYVPNLSADELDGLSKEDIDNLYASDKQRAQAEKDSFLRRKAMENAGIVEPEERKLADEVAPVMSKTVLVEKEGKLENVNIDEFYNGLEQEIVEPAVDKENVIDEKVIDENVIEEKSDENMIEEKVIGEEQIVNK